MCQLSSDFLYEASTQSVCCPSFSYCCPHTVTSCAEPGAVLLNVSALAAAPLDLEETIATAWYDHFAGRGWAACPLRVWNNWSVEAHGRRRCASALSDDDLRFVISVWISRLGVGRAKRGYWIPPDLEESFWTTPPTDGREPGSMRLPLPPKRLSSLTKD